VIEVIDEVSDSITGEHVTDVTDIVVDAATGEVLPFAGHRGVVDGVHATPRVWGGCPSSGCGRLAHLDELVLACDDPEGAAAIRWATRRISVEGRRRVAKPPSLATSWMLMPRPPAHLAAATGRSSTLWMTEPTGCSEAEGRCRSNLSALARLRRSPP